MKRYGKEELKSEKIEEIKDSKKGSRKRRIENRRDRRDSRNGYQGRKDNIILVIGMYGPDLCTPVAN